MYVRHISFLIKVVPESLSPFSSGVVHGFVLPRSEVFLVLIKSSFSVGL